MRLVKSEFGEYFMSEEVEYLSRNGFTDIKILYREFSESEFEEVEI